ncbi:hypothetical protein, partial [Tepidimonas sp.]|uniref:hypothetical protein n=1 Tax=Tepidimonas sp. TaxID=2002775 RepID=UPI00391BF2EB
RKYLSYRTILPGCSPNQALISKGLRPASGPFFSTKRESEPSPDFKGIKTSLAQSHTVIESPSEPSPDFKGIKTT